MGESRAPVAANRMFLNCPLRSLGTKKPQSIDAILDALDDEQAAQLSKKLQERSQYGRDGEE